MNPLSPCRTFMLVHGAWHDSSCWRKLAPLLSAQGHHVIAPDLPGHGQNQIPKQKVSLKVYVRYISSLMSDMQDKSVTLLGHSMAGMVISQVAEQSTDKIAELVYLCAFLPQNNQSLFSLMEQNRADKPLSDIERAMIMSADKRSCQINKKEIQHLFYQHCSLDDSSLAIDHFAPQATLPLAGKVQLSQQRFGMLKKTYITSQDDKVIPLAHQKQMLLRQPCDTVLHLDTDHSPFLSTPKDLSKILLQL